MKKIKASPSRIQILKFTMVLIIPVALIAMTVCVYTLRQSRNDSFERQEAIIYDQTSRTSDTLTQISYYLSDTLANDENIQQLQRNNVNCALDPYRINQVMKDFTNMRALADTGFSFYSSVPERSLKGVSRSAKDSYIESKLVETYIDENKSAFVWTGVQRSIQQIGKNTYYICTVQTRGVYLAAWIDIKNLFSYMDSILQPEKGFYFLVDNENRPLTDQTRFYQSGIEINGSKVQSSIRNAFCTIHPIGGSFQIVSVDVPNLNYNDSWIYLLCVTLLCGVTIIFCGYMIFYFRHYIQAPLLFFQNHVNDYLKERKFSKRYGFAELDEVQSAFSALERQVNDLKIDIYEEKLRRTRTELEFLQNQIKPHFFVNCFNIIIGMAEWEKFDQIQDFCMLLSSYVRYTLCDGFQTVDLKEELAQCRDFLEIQNIRFDSDAVLTDQEDQELLECQIPPLSLLSLIENSVKFNKFKVEHLRLSVDVNKIPGGLNGLLVIDYWDSGVGMSPEECRNMRCEINHIRESVFSDQETVTFTNEHIGIQNVYRRLLLLYGERAKMELLNQPGKGFHLRITFPCSRKSENTDSSGGEENE